MQIYSGFKHRSHGDTGLNNKGFRGAWGKKCTLQSPQYVDSVECNFSRISQVACFSRFSAEIGSRPNQNRFSVSHYQLLIMCNSSGSETKIEIVNLWRPQWSRSGTTWTWSSTFRFGATLLRHSSPSSTFTSGTSSSGLQNWIQWLLDWVPSTRIMVNNGHLLTANLGSLDFLEIF